MSSSRNKNTTTVASTSSGNSNTNPNPNNVYNHRNTSNNNNQQQQQQYPNPHQPQSDSSLQYSGKQPQQTQHQNNNSTTTTPNNNHSNNVAAVLLNTAAQDASRENDPSDKRFYSFFAFRDNREAQETSQLLSMYTNSSQSQSALCKSNNSSYDNTGWANRKSERYTPRNTTVSTKRAGSGFASHWKLQKTQDRTSPPTTSHPYSQSSPSSQQTNQRQTTPKPVQQQQQQQQQFQSFHSYRKDNGSNKYISPQYSSNTNPINHAREPLPSFNTNPPFSPPRSTLPTFNEHLLYPTKSTANSVIQGTVVPRYHTFTQDQVIDKMYDELFANQPEYGSGLIGQRKHGPRTQITIKELLN